MTTASIICPLRSATGDLWSAVFIVLFAAALARFAVLTVVKSTCFARQVWAPLCTLTGKAEVLSCPATGFPAELLATTSSFASPSPIQAQCWPIILAGHDIVGIAATGSGKTHAFGLPAVCHVLAQTAGMKKLGSTSPECAVLTNNRSPLVSKCACPCR